MSNTVLARARNKHDDNHLSYHTWFCGSGGDSQGARAVPFLKVTNGANHWPVAIETHTLNFPDADHYTGDIREAPVHQWPVAKIHWASPECPKWSQARGAARDFHNSQ